ncbi:Gfo/Idh/MocA family protein [Paenibacillus thermoaerophilus]|uniref:Gfo/Idh/MocA family protein n=1 Tax=Paenibacillus thermoaerophilus TaxID=1215385 RepID=A0ABW2V389_9BACL|nr:Gfo/Idh/MocA family oxidoreductase [Paenibacillus thermoaerophilus]TMV14342.1 Gfo/Idh/MocA family oxidoreductase [Paenibacillus thermoaerophilus]
MNDTVKWGVLGYARIAKLSVIPAIDRTEGSTLYAVASGDETKRREIAEAHPQARVYADYESLLRDPEVDAVYVPLPNSMHREWAIRAMRAGKHVLCEKPLALNAEEALEMIRASEQCGVLLMEAFMYRYTDRIARVREVLASGEIGEVRYIQSTFRFLLNRPGTIKMKPELGGGSLYDVGCYPLNFVGMVTGELPESCVVQHVDENGVDVLLSAALRYPSGIVASINCGFNAFNQMNSEIVGTRGLIEIPDTFAGNAGAITVKTEEGVRRIETAESDRYALEVADFAEAVRTGRKPMLSLEETYRNMRALDLVRQAMRK